MRTRYIRIEVATLATCNDISASRLATIIKKAAKATILDEWNMKDEQPLADGDKIFEPKTRSEKLLWDTIRTTAKNDLNSIKKAVDGGKNGGRPTTHNVAELINKTAASMRPGIGIVGKTPVNPQFSSWIQNTFPKNQIDRFNAWVEKNKTGQPMKTESMLKAICTISGRDYHAASAEFLRSIKNI